MIWQALLSKYRARGPVGFAYDALEASAACGVISAHALVLAAGAATLVVVTPVVGAVDSLMRDDVCRCINSFDECRCELAEYRER